LIKYILFLISKTIFKISGNIIVFSSFNPLTISEYSFYTSKKTGLILQGNVIIEGDFTYKTIQHYRILYPDIVIVLSTWKDTDKRFLKKLKSIKNIKVILNDYPVYFGISNINLQILSTVKALSFLKLNGVSYALKTRTDQRINQVSRNYLERFINIIDTNKINLNLIQSKLIFSNMNSFNDRYYSISDMLMFGFIDDMLTYWDCGYDDRSITEVKHEIDSKYFVRESVAEGYLLSCFMNKANYIPRWNDDCSSSFIKKYFYIVEYEYLEQFWFKYMWYLEYSDRYKNIIRKIDL